MLELLTVSNLIIILPYIAAIIAWIFRDRILHKLDVKNQESGLDNIFIKNSEKLISIYSEKMDELIARSQREREDMKKRHADYMSLLEQKLNSAHKSETERIQQQYELQLHDIEANFRIQQKKNEELLALVKDLQLQLEKQMKIEEMLKETIENLEEEIKKLKNRVHELSKKLDYYEKEHNNNIK